MILIYTVYDLEGKEPESADITESKVLTENEVIDLDSDSPHDFMEWLYSTGLGLVGCTEETDLDEVVTESNEWGVWMRYKDYVLHTSIAHPYWTEKAVRADPEGARKASAAAVIERHMQEQFQGMTDVLPEEPATETEPN